MPDTGYRPVALCSNKEHVQPQQGKIMSTLMHGCTCTWLQRDHHDNGHTGDMSAIQCYQSWVRMEAYWKASMSGSSRYPMVGCRDKQDIIR